MDSFERFLKTPQIDMLSAALPYVSDRMRKPLAVYIKSAEIQRILTDFDSEEILSACGFEPSAPDPEAMLKAMKLAGGPGANPQIDQILQMMNVIKTYQKLNEMMQNNPELMSLLTNMMNQTQNSGGSQSDNSNRAEQNNHAGFSSQNSFSSPADLLKQLGNTNSSDMMSLLTQMLKNN